MPLTFCEISRDHDGGKPYPHRLCRANSFESSIFISAHSHSLSQGFVSTCVVSSETAIASLRLGGLSAS